jgi:hypothetical protein
MEYNRGLKRSSCSYSHLIIDKGLKAYIGKKIAFSTGKLDIHM